MGSQTMLRKWLLIVLTLEFARKDPLRKDSVALKTGYDLEERLVADDLEVAHSGCGYLLKVISGDSPYSLH
jgi:hypothetical protein